MTEQMTYYKTHLSGSEAEQFNEWIRKDGRSITEVLRSMISTAMAENPDPVSQVMPYVQSEANRTRSIVVSVRIPNEHYNRFNAYCKGKASPSGMLFSLISSAIATGTSVNLAPKVVGRKTSTVISTRITEEMFDQLKQNFCGGGHSVSTVLHALVMASISISKGGIGHAL